MRSRDSDAKYIHMRLHGPNGGELGNYYTYDASAVTKPLEYKAEESGNAYVSMAGGVRGSAFEFAIHK